MKDNVLEVLWILIQFAWWTFWSICMIIMVATSLTWGAAIMSGQPTTPVQLAHVICVAINIAAVIMKLNKEKEDTRT